MGIRFPKPLLCVNCRHLQIKSGSAMFFSTTSTQPNESEFYDIVIAGGGLVGTILAVALGKLN
jgi:hypothetical protein